MKTDGLDFNGVAMFVAIAEARGVSPAAARLRVPKSSVSRGLTQLESELGVELVARGQRAFTLTEPGLRFYESAARAVASVQDARDSLRQDASGVRGTIRVAAEPTFSAWVLAPIAARFVETYPDVEIELVSSAAEVDALRDRIDVVVTTGKLADSAAIARPLGAIPAAVFASADYLARRPAPRRPDDVRKHECILHRASTRAVRWTFEGPAGRTTVDVSGRLRVDDVSTAMNAARSGAGLAVLPEAIARLYPGAADLVRVLPDYTVVGAPTHLVYAPSPRLPRRVRLFTEAVLEGSEQTCRGHGADKAHGGARGRPSAA